MQQKPPPPKPFPQPEMEAWPHVETNAWPVPAGPRPKRRVGRGGPRLGAAPRRALPLRAACRAPAGRRPSAMIPFGIGVDPKPNPDPSPTLTLDLDD